MHRSELQPIKTAEFTVNSRHHARRRMAQVARSYCWIFIAPVAALLAMSTSDWRLAVVALALIFVAALMITMYVWISLLGHTSAVNDLKPHKVTLEPSGRITIEWSDECRAPVPNAITLNRGDVAYIDADKANICLVLSSRPAGVSIKEIIVPRAAFADEIQLHRFTAAVMSAVTCASAP